MPKRVLITGASQGLGYGIAKTYLEHGYHVFGVDRQPANTAFEAHERYAHHVADLSHFDGCKPAIDACLKEFGELDVLVNNAGIGNARPFLDTGCDDYDRYYAINVKAVLTLSRLVLPTLKRTQGSIVNIASVFGLIGAAGSAAYVPTKYAIVGITRMLATEFGRDRIRVNAVAPGLIWSPATDDRIKNNRWWHRMMIEDCPLQRVGQPEEVGQACVFLSSEAASFINGVVLPVDGGWSIAKFLPEPVGGVEN